jgi:hypothetical protein
LKSGHVRVNSPEPAGCTPLAGFRRAEPDGLRRHRRALRDIGAGVAAGLCAQVSLPASLIGSDGRFSPPGSGDRRDGTQRRKFAMLIILLVLLLALVLAGVGFAVHLLWWLAVIVIVVWLLGFLLRGGGGGGGVGRRRGRWYRW